MEDFSASSVTSSGARSVAIWMARNLHSRPSTSLRCSLKATLLASYLPAPYTSNSIHGSTTPFPSSSGLILGSQSLARWSSCWPSNGAGTSFRARLSRARSLLPSTSVSSYS
eukprot:446486_1